MSDPQNPGDPRVTKMAEALSVFRDPGSKDYREVVEPGPALDRGTQRTSTPEERRRMVDYGAEMVRRAMDGS